jgi:GTP-binding protein
VLISTQSYFCPISAHFQMKITSSSYIKSIVELTQCPTTGYHEYAFIGRSNVGKSSLINLLTGKNNLAKTSVKPGKTQTINYFLINEQWFMVDLPGYGWAKVSREKKIKWSEMVREYLKNRLELRCLFVLIDSRLDPQPIDIEFIIWAIQNKIPLVLVYTKADKVSKNVLHKNINQLAGILGKYLTELPEFFISSSVDRRGKAEILKFIESINENIT